MFRLVRGYVVFFFFFSSRRRHTRYWRDWSSDVCSSDLSLPSTYPNSHITPSHESLLLYLLKYCSICTLPTSSSPSTMNFTLQGTSPVFFRQYSTALMRVISSPLSSAEPLPNT